MNISPFNPSNELELTLDPYTKILTFKCKMFIIAKPNEDDNWNYGPCKFTKQISLEKFKEMKYDYTNVMKDIDDHFYLHGYDKVLNAMITKMFRNMIEF